MVQRMNYKRDLARIEYVIGQARSAAWGNKIVPGEGQRKVLIAAILCLTRRSRDFRSR